MKGYVWDQEKRKFMYSEDRKNKDVVDNELDEVRISREVLLAMNSVIGDLTFTSETMSEFENKSIPTLDFNLWLSTRQGAPALFYKFFSKPLVIWYVVLESSVWGWNSKCTSLSPELHRRMQNSSRDLPREVEMGTLR